MSKFNTQYVYQRKIEHIVHTLHYCNSGKCKETKLLLLNKGMKSKEPKSEKIEKRKKKRAKSMQWRERTKRRKRRRMQSPSPQRLNGERERERESRLCKSVRNIFSVLQDCCNCVVMYERQSFKLFNFFAMYK